MRVGGRGRRRDPRRSRSAARRRSASRPRTGSRSRRSAARISTRRTTSSSSSRPTAVNLRWALDELRDDPTPERARALHEDEVERCRRMGEHAAELVRAGRAAPHALQHGRARDGRLRIGARRGARGLGARARRARLGRRDAAAAPGRAADRVGARGARDPVLRDRRRSGGVAHGARARSTPCSPGRTGSRPTATSRTRSARMRSRSPRRITSSRSTSSRPPRRSTRAPRPARTSRSRSATRARSRARFPARNPAFDVTPAELVTAIVTEVGVHRAPYAASLPDPARARRDRRRSRDRGDARALRVRRDALRDAAGAGRGGRALRRVERHPRARSSRRAPTT